MPSEESLKHDCSICEASFKKLSNLKRHVDNLHRHRKFSCPICDKQYTGYSAQKEHIKIVHKGFRYSCDHCEATFTNRVSLRNHKSRRNLSEFQKLINK